MIRDCLGIVLREHNSDDDEEDGSQRHGEREEGERGEEIDLDDSLTPPDSPLSIAEVYF